jgi:hypothetical protein
MNYQDFKKHPLANAPWARALAPVTKNILAHFPNMDLECHISDYGVDDITIQFNFCLTFNRPFKLKALKHINTLSFHEFKPTAWHHYTTAFYVPLELDIILLVSVHEYGLDSYRHNRFIMDSCYDKISKAPVDIPIPRTELGTELLLALADWFATYDGHRECAGCFGAIYSYNDLKTYLKTSKHGVDLTNFNI